MRLLRLLTFAWLAVTCGLVSAQADAYRSPVVQQLHSSRHLQVADNLLLLNVGRPPTAAGVVVTWDTVNTGSNLTYSNSNKTASQATGNFNIARSTVSHASPDKVYVEFTVTGTNLAVSTNVGLGVINATGTQNFYLGSDANSVGYYANGGVFYNGGSGTYTGGFSYGSGAVIGMAVDYSASPPNICFTADGTNWNAPTGNTTCPSTGTGAWNPSVSTPSFFATSLNAGNGPASTTLNNGPTYAYTKPSGYSAW